MPSSSKPALDTEAAPVRALPCQLHDRFADRRLARGPSRAEAL